MKYLQGSFTVASGQHISQEEWDAVFHPEKCQPVVHKTPVAVQDDAIIPQEDFNEDLPELPEWEDDGGVIHDELLSQQNPLSQADGFADDEEYIKALIKLYGED